ncbi:hypothetical protein GCM10023183_27630 [Nibribacter koreensis]|uniref:Uncharacterized protein n=2 Tax=Nibribacter koreensis TaxID=1084519 RepID=A0ABP8FSI5_9BACT
MGEYPFASPTRRSRIIYDAKYPKSFITARYSKAEASIKEFFLNKYRDRKLITQSIEELTNLKPTSKYHNEVIYSCIEALTEFLKFIEGSELVENDKDYFDGISKSASIKISGVEISIRPEILIQDKGKVTGGVKLYFAKTYPLTKPSAEFIGTLLMKYLKEQTGSDIKARNCFVIDIFNKTIYTAPKAYSKRLLEIEAACEEISSRWSSI